MSRLYPCVYCTEDGYCEKYSDDEVTSWCVQGPCKDERPSNADRLRAMSDEELAAWLATVPMSYEYACPNPIPKECNGGDRETCIQCWLDWLRQEASDG